MMLPKAMTSPIAKFTDIPPRCDQRGKLTRQSYARLFPATSASCKSSGQFRPARAVERLAPSQALLMQNGLYVALSAQVALERRLETIAANVANMNTPGYRADGISFEAQSPRRATTLAYVSSGADFISRKSGALVKTGNPLDVAVQGDGWFAVRRQRTRSTPATDACA